MLKSKLLHPEILQALASNGHGARVLIADGNYPFSTGVPPTAKKVFLNLAPGILTFTEVLAIIAEHIPVEDATLLVPPDGSDQPIHDEFKDILGEEVQLEKLKRFDFYDKAKLADTCLIIATGETRRFANILLTIGVIK
jgi:L-fucose mutarotase